MSMRDKIARALVDSWFGKSRVVNKAGEPLVVYRGEHGPVPEQGGFQSRLNSLSFGDAETASTYAMKPNDYRDLIEAPRVTPGHLRIENPIIEAGDDPFVDIGHLEDKLGPRHAQRLARKYADSIENTNNWEENFADRYHGVEDLLKQSPQDARQLYFDSFRYLDDPREVDLLKKRGFDGAIVGGMGENAGQVEYRIFDPSQWRTSIKGALIGGPLAGAMGGLGAQDQYGAQ